MPPEASYAGGRGRLVRRSVISTPQRRSVMLPACFRRRGALFAASLPTRSPGLGRQQTQSQPLYCRASPRPAGRGSRSGPAQSVGPEQRDIYAPGKSRFAPCRGCPTLWKDCPTQAGERRAGGFPLSSDYSDYELAGNSRVPLDPDGPRHSRPHPGDGDDDRWTDDPKTAQKNAVGHRPATAAGDAGKTNAPMATPPSTPCASLHPRRALVRNHAGEVPGLEASRRQAAALPTGTSCRGCRRSLTTGGVPFPRTRGPQPWQRNSAWNLYNNPVVMGERRKVLVGIIRRPIPVPSGRGRNWFCHGKAPPRLRSSGK